MVICVHLGEKLGFSLTEVKHLIEGIVTAIRAGLDPLGQDSYMLALVGFIVVVSLLGYWPALTVTGQAGRGLNYS